jgi:hypothetical protein
MLATTLLTTTVLYQAYTPPPMFDEMHPLIYDSSDCYKGQQLAGWTDFRVEPTDNVTTKVRFQHKQLPNNIFLDWVMKIDLDEFWVYKCDIKHIDLGNFGFMQQLHTVTVTSSTLQTLENRKRDCTTPELFVSLRNIDFSYNRIQFIDMNVFRKIKFLRKVNLTGNQLKRIDGIIKFINHNKHVYLVDFGYVHKLPCGALEVINRLDLTDRKKYQAKCKYDAKIVCSRLIFECPVENVLSPFTHYRMFFEVDADLADVFTETSSSPAQQKVFIIILVGWLINMIFM